MQSAQSHLRASPGMLGKKSDATAAWATVPATRKASGVASLGNWLFMGKCMADTDGTQISAGRRTGRTEERMVPHSCERSVAKAPMLGPYCHQPPSAMRRLRTARPASGVDIQKKRSDRRAHGCAWRGHTSARCAVDKRRYCAKRHACHTRRRNGRGGPRVGRRPPRHAAGARRPWGRGRGPHGRGGRHARPPPPRRQWHQRAPTPARAPALGRRRASAPPWAGAGRRRRRRRRRALASRRGRRAPPARVAASGGA